MTTPVVMLYIPGSDERKLQKISTLMAPAYILDLEDAVVSSAKPLARRQVATALSEYGESTTLWVRTNDTRTDLLYEDLDAIVVPGLAGIILPKVESASEVTSVDAALKLLELQRTLPPGSVRLLATIETVRGLTHVSEIAGSSSRLECLGFGAGDFSLDIGLPWPGTSAEVSATLASAKTALVFASREARLQPPHDGALLDFKNLGRLRRETWEARAMGFGGKHAIHPNQIAVIKSVFEGDPAELQHARDIVSAFEQHDRVGVGSIGIRGKVIDQPVVEQARRRLAEASMQEDAIRGLPLDGVRVLDLSTLYAAPLISTTLADFGAEVIKVEHPRGDDARRWGLSKDGVPLWWKTISRNKQLIALDLNVTDDRASIRELATWADVIVENFRPGRLEGWDLGPDELCTLNPQLIFVRVTGWGQTGPYSSRPGFGTLAEAFSGFAHITGLADGPPTLPPFGLADGVAGIMGAFAVMVALYWRDAQASGEGQVIDLSIYEPLFSILGPQVTEYSQLGVIQERQGNRSSRSVPRNTYLTLDKKWVAVSAGTQQIANRIFAAIGRSELSEDERFKDADGRRAHADLLDDLVGAWVASHTLDAVLESFNAREAPIAPVYDAAQIVSDPHYRARESVVECVDKDLGRVLMANVAPRLSKTPGSIRWTGRTTVDADRENVLAVIGRRAAVEKGVRGTRPSSGREDEREE